MSAEAIERSKAGRFKTGQKNHNELYDGAITIRNASAQRGSGKHYVVRLSKGNWKELQIFNWEKEHGPVPKGFVLACRDGNTLNCDPNNWYLLSMKENMKRNSGNLNLPDKYVAHLLAGKKNKSMKQVYLKHPELLDLKRNQVLLNRTINGKRKESTADQGNT